MNFSIIMPISPTSSVQVSVTVHRRVQDNSEAQSALLHRIFVEGISRSSQRFGDMNQAIFGTPVRRGSTIRSPARSCGRYQQSQIRTADCRLRNHLQSSPGVWSDMASGTLIRADTAGKHTIFLFDEHPYGL